MTDPHTISDQLVVASGWLIEQMADGPMVIAESPLGLLRSLDREDRLSTGPRPSRQRLEALAHDLREIVQDDVLRHAERGGWHYGRLTGEERGWIRARENPGIRPMSWKASPHLVVVEPHDVPGWMPPTASEGHGQVLTLRTTKGANGLVASLASLEIIRRGIRLERL